MHFQRHPIHRCLFHRHPFSNLYSSGAIIQGDVACVNAAQGLTEVLVLGISSELVRSCSCQMYTYFVKGHFGCYPAK